ncbi:alpha-L-rhamnosidase [Xylocopilactobacillus apis]|uniref:alpha-L-rhamnosidase n=1 Tax=Xylocopilactobacillus apis TaxID=2932183 RepID=A0AAU9CSJ0_9LACO|nr:alpha-L-rhamnosidase [Xylocopilactobacillus apis]BDR56954.1 alfa-L-rhamnosidase [Xylocopilactobacillus apis]
MDKNKADLWQGKWISSPKAIVSEEPEFTLEEMFSGQLKPQLPVDERLHPVVYFKKIFELTQPVKKANLEITAQGIYQAFINGRKVTEAVFTPDYTDYHDFLQYQTFDVRDQLIEGNNSLCVEVADGWYAGRISVQGGSCQFGNQLALLADLKIELQDGSKLVIGTDNTFSTGDGKHRYADIDIGEKQDLRLDDEWLKNNQDFSESAVEITADYSRLSAQEGPLVFRNQALSSQKIWEEEAELVVDFGQVIAGRVRLTAVFPQNKEVVIKHSEVLDENGKFFQNIIGRNKDQTDIFIGNGKEETVEPDFTFHGFRYVKISGLKRSNLTKIEAIPIYSNMSETGWIETSNSKINQLLSNIKWSQRGNMLSIPTDCPQRERVGWTGDMQVFAPASTFYLNTNQFIKRWLKNVRIDQRSNGEIIDYSPAPKDAAKSVEFTGSYSSAGWGDAIIMVPWTLYQRFDDKEALAENYDSMVKWFNFSKESAAGDKTDDRKYLWDTKFHYGDWMLPSLMMESGGNPMATSKATKELVATTFLKHSSELMAEISDLLGHDSTAYRQYADKVKAAFIKYYITEDSRLVSDYQGCYVLALAFDMVPAEKKPELVERLVQKIHDNGDCLDTGFLATPYLLDVLTDNGETELAAELFLQAKCPSWMYEVDQGATTIWETWSGIQPDGKVGQFSFNHYSMGCVLDWFVRKVIGMNSTKPGFKEIKIFPQVQVCDQLKSIFDSPNGLIKVEINYQNRFDLTVSLPEKMKAIICLPYKNEEMKKEIMHKYSMGVLNSASKCVEVAVEAGKYHFAY